MKIANRIDRSKELIEALRLQGWSFKYNKFTKYIMMNNPEGGKIAFGSILNNINIMNDEDVENIGELITNYLNTIKK